MLTDILQELYLGLGALLLLACVVSHGLMRVAMTNIGNYDRFSFALSWLFCLPLGALGIYCLWLALPH
jgi:hypothetical protein